MKRISLVGAVGVLGLGAALFPATSALAAPAARTAAGPVTYHGTTHQITRVAQDTKGLTHLPAVTHRAAGTATPRLIPFRSPAGPDPASHNAGLRQSAMRSGSPAAPAYTMSGTNVSVLHRFNGLSDADQAALNGGGAHSQVTPPDQGLCAGHVAGYRGNLVFEMVNSAIVVAKPNGTPIFAAPLSAWFHDSYALGDPRCLYDPAAKSFYFTEIGFPASGPNSTLTNTTVDVAVINAKGNLADYQVDSSMGGHCLGDQPKTGFSNKALLVSTDEYCGSTLANYEGAIVLDIPRSELLSEPARISDEQFGPVSLAGIPVVGLDPAINTGTTTGYFVNSFAFDAAGNPNEVSSSLGLWSLSGGNLTGRVIHSESYAFPVPALSTGTGATSSQGITSEAVLNPDDSRISGPVNVTHAGGRLQLWTALDAAVAPKGDPTARDGAAWFRIDTGSRKVVSQGYVAAKGHYLLYPAVQAPAGGGPAAMVFTVTSPTINPAAAFTTVGSGRISVVAPGSGPHLSFSDSPPYNQARWGDYSFTALNPGTSGIWLATEYIPPKADWGSQDNWGTYVFEVAK